MITQTDAIRVSPALSGLLHGFCGEPMEPVARSGDRFDYLCPPSCGMDHAPVVTSDDQVWDLLASYQGWLPDFALENRPKRRDLTRNHIQRVDLLPGGELSITYAPQ